MLVCEIMLVRNLRPAIGGDLAEKLRDYIAVTLHQPVALGRWDGSAGLPTFLSHRYDFHSGSVANQPCLFAIDLNGANATPAEISKHIARISDGFKGSVIYVAHRLSSDRRSRLIAHGVPFVIPGNQLYIPALAIDLREHFRARPKRHLEQLSPVAQVILFHYLLRVDERQDTPSRLSEALPYSAMSIGRGFEELLSQQLVTISKRGRTKRIEFIDEGHALLDAARPLLRNPVRGQRYIRDTEFPGAERAGETALAACTELSPPRVTVAAIHIYKWWEFSKRMPDNFLAAHAEEAGSLLELWHYDPRILSINGVVDPLSLYAQFWDHTDERVSKAAQDLLEQIAW